MLRDTFGFLGTGIWPYRISGLIGARNMTLKYGDSTVNCLTRDYLSFLYLPLFPLGLSALIDFGSQRVSLDRKGKDTVVGATMSVYGTRAAERERKLAWVRRQWFLAFLVAVSGATLGYFVVGGYLLNWAPGLYTLLGALLGSAIANRIFLSSIGYKRGL